MYGAATDVHDQRLAMEALRESEQRYHLLFAASPAPLLILKPDAPRYTITDVNDAYLTATVRSREDVVGRGLSEAYPDDPNAKLNGGVSVLRASIESVLATRQAELLPALKYNIPKPDGTLEERWWSSINSPVLDEHGEVKAIIHNANDITKERQALAAMLESKERFRLFVENVREYAFVQTDFEGVVTSWNPGTERLFGSSSGEVLGKPFSMLLPEEDRHDGLIAREMATLSRGEKVVDAHAVQRKDGTRFWAEWIRNLFWTTPENSVERPRSCETSRSASSLTRRFAARSQRKKSC